MTSALSPPSGGLSLVTGATGALGPTLVAGLVAAGGSVRALCRQLPRDGLLPDSVLVELGDVTRPQDVATAMRGVERVFHLASRLHVTNPEPSRRAEYEACNVGGTRHVVDAARSQGARVVLFSSIVVYGPTYGKPVDEASPTRPAGLYAETKRRAEELVLNSGVPAVILRLAAVYGPRMKGNYSRLAFALARRRFVPIGTGENRRTLIHEKDVARAALLTAGRPEALGQILNVTDGEIHSMRRILAAMCAALGRSEPTWRIPTAVARLAASATDVASSALGLRGGYGGLLDKYLESVEVRGEKIQRLMGFRPSFDLEAGWRDALGRAPAMEL